MAMSVVSGDARVGVDVNGGDDGCGGPLVGGGGARSLPEREAEAVAGGALIEV